VSFVFVPPGDITELGAIIAVGFRNGAPVSSGAVFHAELGVGRIVVHDLQLHAAVDPRLSATNKAGETQLVLWGPSAGDHACAYLHDTSPGADTDHQHRNAFVVAENDRDCDGYADDDLVNECARDIYRGTTPPRRSDLACVVSVPSTSTVPEYCTLGGPPCVDGQPRDPNACTPSRFCAGNAVCGACDLAGSNTEACMADPLAAPQLTAMFGITCHVTTIDDPMTPLQLPEVCPATFTTSLPFPTGLAAPACSRAMIRTPLKPFVTQLVLEGTTVDVATADDCTLTMKGSGTSPRLPNGGGVRRLGGIVTVDFSNNRSMVVPVVLNVSAQLGGPCPPPVECTVIGTPDAPLACAARPPP
jgi:hypothetical protein